MAQRLAFAATMNACWGCRKNSLLQDILTGKKERLIYPEPLAKGSILSYSPVPDTPQLA
jgi:hypothetical protein